MVGPRNQLPTLERLNSVLSYDPKTGIFRWISGNRAGYVAGARHSSGRIAIQVDGAFCYAHRLAWKMMTGNEPPEFIDHRNCNQSDNTWGNLRSASVEENSRNTSLSRANTSGAKGVVWNRSAQKWQAQIGRGGYIGLFNDFNDAVSAVETVRKELHGEFARSA
jgi:hypothetical protein